MQSFSFSPLKTSEKKIFEYFFFKFNVSVAMATNQNQQFRQNSYEDYFRNISVKNICNEIAINLNFHFSHYKSMETKLP